MGIIPFKMDLVLFALAGLPFLVSILAIRHFVQRWVMGRGERGTMCWGLFADRNLVGAYTWVDLHHHP